MSGRLEGRIAMVTGAGTGPGATIAEALAADGADVAAHHRSSAAGAEATAERIRALGRDAETVQGDIAAWEDVQRMAREVVDRFGRVDVLVDVGREDRRTGRREEVLAATPLARIPAPADIVPPVVFLASDDSCHITGAFLLCDGGHGMVGA